jgi:serine/threonine protein kinase
MAGEGEHLGEGTFGIVKLAEDADGKQYALKTSINRPEEEKVIPGANEAETLEDLGLSWGINLSRGTTQYPRSKESKHVAALKYLGISLDEYLKSHESLTRKQRYDLAIKTAECVYRLHHGYDSKQGIKRAHLDIKPHNFCIDEHGEVTLIDYGSASELSGKNTLNSRTIPYSPLLDLKIRRNEYFDIFALKRVLFLPEEYWADYTAQRLERWQAGEYILRDELDFLDTSNGRLAQHQHTAADVLAILILSKHNLYTSENSEKVLQDSELFYDRYKALSRYNEPELSDLQKIINGVAPAIPPEPETPKYERGDSDSGISSGYDSDNTASSNLSSRRNSMSASDEEERVTSPTNNEPSGPNGTRLATAFRLYSTESPNMEVADAQQVVDGSPHPGT